MYPYYIFPKTVGLGTVIDLALWGSEWQDSSQESASSYCQQKTYHMDLVGTAILVEFKTITGPVVQDCGAEFTVAAPFVKLWIMMVPASNHKCFIPADLWALTIVDRALMRLLQETRRMRPSLTLYPDSMHLLTYLKSEETVTRILQDHVNTNNIGRQDISKIGSPMH